MVVKVGDNPSDPCSVWGCFEGFLEENGLNISPANTAKLLAILKDPQQTTTFQVELAIIVDVCKPFVEATYLLEGDGPLAFHAYEILDKCANFIYSQHYLKTTAFLRERFKGAPSTYSNWMQFAIQCIQPGLGYFVEKFSSDLAVAVNAFKSARLFFPPKVCEMKPVANDIQTP